MYVQKLVARGAGDPGAGRQRSPAASKEKLDGKLAESRKGDYLTPPNTMGGVWAAYLGGPEKQVPEVRTSIPRERLDHAARGAQHPAGRLHRQRQGEEGAREAHQRGRAERPPVLGDRRAARLRDHPRGQAPDPPERAGRAPRHLQPPSRGGVRRPDRPSLRAAERGRGRLGHTLRGLGQPAQRGRRPRLRVRLQPRHARGARHLGSAVRRLRQQRPGDHRPVLRLGGGQVAAPVRSHACSSRTATRARVRSTRARASSASCRWPPRTTCR